MALPTITGITLPPSIGGIGSTSSSINFANNKSDFSIPSFTPTSPSVSKPAAGSYMMTSIGPKPSSNIGSVINNLAGSTPTSTGVQLTAQQKADNAAYLANIGKTGNPGDTLVPAQGTPEYAALQTSTYSPKNYSISQSQNGTVSGSMMGGSITPSSLESMRAAKQSAMTNGSNQSLIPSDSLLGNYANQIYNTALYSPQQQQAIQYGNDLNTKIAATNLASRRQIQQLWENGSITKDQAAGFISDSQRRSDAQLADLGVAQQANSNQLNTLGQYQQNQLGALNALAGFIKPEAVAPGSQLINSFGQQSGQSTGVSPTAAASYASQLFNDDLKTGSPHLTPDGQIDTQFYYQKAQQTLGGQSQMSPIGGSSSGSYSPGSTGSGQLPAALQPYVINSQDGTPPYINADRIPTAQADFIKQQAAQNGIPVLSTGDVNSFQSILYTQENIGKLSTVMNDILSPGVLGRGANIARNAINAVFQNDPRLVAFNQARDTAIKSIQSLVAGSGSGFRLTQPEIDTATSNMPTANDNLETAQAKVDWVNNFLNTKKNLLLTGTVNGQQTKESNGLYDF